VNGGERLRRVWIVVVGLLALAAIATLAFVGVSAHGGHTWIFAIKTAMSSAVSGVFGPTGGHTWIF
jgi:hypothetical protein